MKLSTTPIIEECSGLYYFKGWNVKLEVDIEDSSGPYFIKFQDIDGQPVQKYLQDADLEYYETAITAEISVNVIDNGDYDYSSGFYAYIEDSVGNNVSLYIVAGGLPAYTSDEVKNIYENSESGRKKTIAGVEWMTVNGSGNINLEGSEWLLNKITTRIKDQLDLIFEKEDRYNQSKNINYMWGIKENLKIDFEHTIDFLVNFNFCLSNTDGPQTRSYSDQLVFNWLWQCKFITDTTNSREALSDTYKTFFGDDPFADGSDNDGCPNYIENAFSNYGMSNSDDDSDNDGVSDPHEFRVIYRTNYEYGQLDDTNSNLFIALQLWSLKFQTEYYYRLYGYPLFKMNCYQYDKTFSGNYIEELKATNSNIKPFSRTMEYYRIYLIENGESIIIEVQKGAKYLSFKKINPTLSEQFCMYPSIGENYKEIVIKYTDPGNSDTDRDGLNDKFEVYEFTEFDDGEMILWDSIPYNEKPNPLIKDIYVEVDWMKNCPEYNQELQDKYPGGLIPSLLDLWKLTNHKISDEVKKKAIEVFKKCPIEEVNLHIDDGTGIWEKENQGNLDYSGDVDGGGSVPHISKLTETDESSYYNYYFGKERIGIFHYCIFAHKNEDGSGSSSGESGTPGISDSAHTSGVTDKFVVYHSVLKEQNSETIAGCFIHELGHNIVGWVDSFHQSQEDYTSFWHPHADGTPQAHCRNDCVMYFGQEGGKYRWSFSKRPIDFCDDCWNEIINGGFDNEVTIPFRPDPTEPDISEGLGR